MEPTEVLQVGRNYVHQFDEGVYVIRNLPTGLTYQHANNKITGTPKHTGIWIVDIDEYHSDALSAKKWGADTVNRAFSTNGAHNQFESDIDAPVNSRSIVLEVTPRTVESQVVRANALVPCLFGDQSPLSGSPPTINLSGAKTGFVGQPLSYTFSVSDDDGDTVTCTATGLPAGLTLSGTTISGTPTAATSGTVTITCTDSSGQITTTQLNCVIYQADVGFFVDSNAVSNGDGSMLLPWNELDRIDYSLIDASTNKTVFVAGGVYNTQLAPQGTVEQIIATGPVDHVGPRLGLLPECGITGIATESNTGFNGIDLSNTNGTIISGSNWNQWVVRNWQSDGIKMTNATANVTLEYMEIRNNGWVTNPTSWDCTRPICGNNICVYMGVPRSFTNGAGIRLAGTAIVIQNSTIHDNGQDAIQSQNLGVVDGLIVRNNLIYNGRENLQVAGSGGPLAGPWGESAGYCAHQDGIQLYQGTNDNILIENNVILHMQNGLILGQDPIGTASASNVTIRNTHFINNSDNGILSYPNIKNDNWTLDRVIVYAEDTRNSHLQATGLSDFWTVDNTLIGDNGSFGCTEINFFNMANFPTGTGNYAATGLSMGTGSTPLFTVTNIVWNSPPSTFNTGFDYDLSNSVSVAVDGTASDIIGATVGTTFNINGSITVV